MLKVLFAAAILAAALYASAAAAPSGEDLSRQTALRVIDAAPAVTAGVRLNNSTMGGPVTFSATTPSFLVNFVATGPALSGVPCFGCIRGAGGFTLGLPAPFNYVPLGGGQQYNISWTTISFTGSCKIAIAITAGTRTLDSFSYNIPKVGKMGAYDLGFNRGRPSYHGSALVVGKVTCGTAMTTQAPIFFQ